MKRLKKAVFAAWIASVTAALFVGSAAALSITSAAITFPDVVLNGQDQLTDGSTSAWRANGIGESGGWNVTVSSTSFGDGAGHTISVANFELRLEESNIVWVSGDLNGPVSTQTSFTALSGTALKVASAAAGNGNGEYDLTPDFRLTIPAETYAGAYTATVTITIASGP